MDWMRSSPSPPTPIKQQKQQQLQGGQYELFTLTLLQNTLNNLS